jgi:hypothetical protein
MISLFATVPRLSASLALKCYLVGSLALFACGAWAQQDDPDRPHLSHQTQPIPQHDPPIDTEALADAVPGTPIGDGLALPSFGHVWVRDDFEGRPQLVQLKYVPTDVNRHACSNFVKAELAPFVYRPKVSIEIADAAANVRLHDPNVSIYVRGFGGGNEDAAPTRETSTQTELALVRAKSKKDRRIISTIAFTQLTGKAARSNDLVVFNIEKVGSSGWQKITTKGPLPPGEYALVCMPRGQNLLPTRVFDFAIDPKAPANANAVMPAPVTPSR